MILDAIINSINGKECETTQVFSNEVYNQVLQSIKEEPESAGAIYTATDEGIVYTKNNMTLKIYTFKQFLKKKQERQ